MDISKILEIFTSINTNNDKILSKDEIKNSPYSIWGNKIVGTNFEQFEKICTENGGQLLKSDAPPAFEDINTQTLQQLPSKEEVKTPDKM